MISSILVGDCRMSAKRICIIYMYIYMYMIWSILVGVLANTGWRFGQYRGRYIFQDLGRFEVEIGDSKNMGVLKIMLRYEFKNKKISILAPEVSLLSVNFLDKLSSYLTCQA